MVAVKILGGLFLFLAGGLFPAAGQMAPAAGTPPVFSLLNLIRSPQPAVLKIGSLPVGEGQMSLGFFTGIVTWLPTVPLVVEAPGFAPLRIPVPSSGPDECPLFVIQDALEKPPGGGEAKPILKFLSVPNAKDRPAYFTDGLNLTTRNVLRGTLDGKTVSLELGRRTRITTQNGFVFKIENGPELAIGGSEEPGGMLAVFYENPNGEIEYALTNDLLIRR